MACCVYVRSVAAAFIGVYLIDRQDRYYKDPTNRLLSPGVRVWCAWHLISHRAPPCPVDHPRSPPALSYNHIQWWSYCSAGSTLSSHTDPITDKGFRKISRQDKFISLFHCRGGDWVEVLCHLVDEAVEFLKRGLRNCGRMSQIEVRKRKGGRSIGSFFQNQQSWKLWKHFQKAKSDRQGLCRLLIEHRSKSRKAEDHLRWLVFLYKGLDQTESLIWRPGEISFSASCGLWEEGARHETAVGVQWSYQPTLQRDVFNTLYTMVKTAWFPWMSSICSDGAGGGRVSSPLMKGWSSDENEGPCCSSTCPRFTSACLKGDRQGAVGVGRSQDRWS